MKNFKKYVLVSVVMIFAMLVFAAQGVNASSLSIFSATNGTNTANTTNATNSTNVTALTTNTSTTNTTSVVKVNTINDASKDLPKTGENDVYIISAIGVIAIIVGIAAYAQSKKYDLR
jgi:LPXTG-motif cell wall-anchored protein